MNRYRDFIPMQLDDDEPQPNQDLATRVSHGLDPVVRNTVRNRRLARSAGWSETDFENWVEGGEAPW